MSDSVKARYLTDLDYFQSLLAKEPESTYYVPVALMYSNLGQHDEVIAVCKDGLRIYPDFSHLKVLMAQSYMHIGHRSDAMDILLDVLVADEDNFLALKLMAQMQKASKNNDEAGKYMRAAYLKAPEDTELLEWLDEMGLFDSVYNQPLVDNDEEDDDSADDEFTYDVDEKISQAKEAIEDLKKDVASAKRAGKTAEQMFAAAAAESKAAEPEKAPDELAGKELSDEEIMSALAEMEPDDDLYDDEDIFDLTKGKLQIVDSNEINAIIVKGTDLPFSGDDDDDYPDEEKFEDFIPTDLVESVYSESGIDNVEDIFNDDERITPENIKGGTDAK